MSLLGRIVGGISRRHPTLRTQLLWAFSLVGAAPVLLLGFVQAHAAAEGERERADRETVLASSALGRELGRIMDADAASVRALAVEMRERNALDPDVIDRATRRHLETSPSMYTTLVIGTDGKTVSGRVREGGGTKHYGGTSYADRSYFQRVLGGARFASELVHSKATGQPALILAMPIFDQSGKLMGVAAAGVDLLFVKHAVERVTAVAPGLSSVVLDEERRVVAGAGSGEWTPLRKLPALPLYRTAAGAEPERRAGSDEGGIDRRGTVATIQTESVRWSVVSTWADSALTERALGALRATLGFVLVGIALAIVAGVVMARLVARPMVGLSRLVEAIARGDLRLRPDPPRRSYPREMVELGRSMGSLLGYLEELVTELGGTVGTIRTETQRLRGASGEMLEDSQAQRNAVRKSSGAIVQMTDSIDGVGKSVLDLSHTALETTRSIENLDQEITRIADSLLGLAQTIGAASSQVHEVETEVGQVTASAGMLRRNVDETRHSLGLLSESIQHVAGGALRGEALVGDALAAAEAGREAVAETIGATQAIHASFADLERAVQALAGRSEAIGAVVSVIDEVTRATELLAINASIIAAQAGDQGRGFGVVAERIKAVATETAASTHRITALVASVQADINAAVSAVASGRRTVRAGEERSAEAGIRLRAIIESSGESATTVRQIAASAREQARLVSQVERAFQEVDLATAQISEAADRQRQAQQRMTEAIAEVRAIGSEVQRATESQRGDSHAIAAAVSGMSSRFQAIVMATRQQDNEQNRIRTSLGVFDDATKSSVERARQIGQAVSALNSRLEQLEEQLRAFRVS